eukprot:CAMPEP_0117000320 /NCGR_PEP_ID=MMETSP0472-20121206/2703_1 /TAXON_ID=693140 ORGANISM="Tiarina fusus, Strain LIS" /NCGR_SAMPLE_ID=MMETSP0472 /ASSEMBLY_ACC=CAM_ASM_000603 /LENGTH=265 /DNA_ID=CAMNT_0004699977 /DNA_START=109 /DNA_END=903 /DNA_ORIENTATION=+
MARDFVGHAYDFSEYDVESGTWRELASLSAGAPPLVRNLQGFAESNGKLYVFGGDNGSESYKNDLHEYDIASAVWTDLSSPTAGPAPSSRVKMGFTGSNGRLYVFGGAEKLLTGSESYRQDLHEYDIVSGTWTDLSTLSTGTPPSARTSMGFVESNGKLYVFGGYDGSSKNDLHEYDTALGAWTDLSWPRAGTSPSPRHHMGIAEKDRKLFVFGGSYDSGRGDLHEYDIQTGSWRSLQDAYSDRSFVGFAASYRKLFAFLPVAVG